MTKQMTFKRGQRLYIVRDGNVIGCPDWRWLEVWEGPIRGEPQHSTITTFAEFPGVWFGRLGTRALPEWINKIPGWGHKTLDERVRLCRRFQNQQSRVAQCLFAKFISINKYDPNKWKMDYEGSEARYVA